MQSPCCKKLLTNEIIYNLEGRCPLCRSNNVYFKFYKMTDPTVHIIKQQIISYNDEYHSNLTLARSALGFGGIIFNRNLKFVEPGDILVISMQDNIISWILDETTKISEGTTMVFEYCTNKKFRAYGGIDFIRVPKEFI